MTAGGTENSLPKHVTHGQDTHPPVSSQSERVGDFRTHTLVKFPRDGTYAVYRVQGQNSEATSLGLESYAPQQEGEASYISGYWDSVIPLEDFLNTTDVFLARHSAIDAETSGVVNVVVIGDEGDQQYEAKRPITKEDLLAVEAERIGTNAERLTLLRLDTNDVGFIWQPETVGFILTPGSYSDQNGMIYSLANFYD